MNVPVVGRLDDKSFLVGFGAAIGLMLVPKVGSWLFEQVGNLRNKIGSSK